jgi:hypothetical protein
MDQPPIGFDQRRERMLDHRGAKFRPRYKRPANAAARWRAKAEECRTMVEMMSSESARRTLLQMAQNYDALAERPFSSAARTNEAQAENSTAIINSVARAPAPAGVNSWIAARSFTAQGVRRAV